MNKLGRLIAVSAVLVASAAGAAELYKWVDERGVTNYSSDPPPKGRARTPIAEDRVSVYTPEPAVTQAIEAERNRRTTRPHVAAPAPVPAPAVPAPPSVAAPPVVAPPPPVATAPGGVIGVPRPNIPGDPCMPGSTDPNCYATTIYDHSPVFVGRTARPPVLNQPQLPPGAIAGNVTGGTAVQPGLSGLSPSPPISPPPRTIPRPRPNTVRELTQ